MTVHDSNRIHDTESSPGPDRPLIAITALIAISVVVVVAVLAARAGLFSPVAALLGASTIGSVLVLLGMQWAHARATTVLLAGLLLTGACVLLAALVFPTAATALGIFALFVVTAFTLVRNHGSSHHD